MLFHITAQHYHLSCGSNKARQSGIDMTEFQRKNGRWMEGTDKVKVIAAYVNNPAHRSMMIVEANDYAGLNTFTNRFNDIGDCDVQVVGDGIAMRKTAGNWGQ